MKPLPITSTPSSRSGASALPIANSSFGSMLGSEICSTGSSASGYMHISGTYVP